MFVLKMSCIDFNTAMYLLPVEVLQFSTNFYACAASVAYTDVTPLLLVMLKGFSIFHPQNFIYALHQEIKASMGPTESLDI